MTDLLTHDQAINALVRQFGVERKRAIELLSPQNSAWVAIPPDRGTQTILALPLAITVPWSHLVSDNAKYGAVIKNGKPRLLLTADYRRGKDGIEGIARRAVGDALPADGELSLSARIWVPDNRRHDITNFAKICGDALERIVYGNDNQLKRTTWEWAGVDVDAPRADITVDRYCVKRL